MRMTFCFCLFVIFHNIFSIFEVFKEVFFRGADQTIWREGTQNVHIAKCVTVARPGPDLRNSTQSV